MVKMVVVVVLDLNCGILCSKLVLTNFIICAADCSLSRLKTDSSV